MQTGQRSNKSRLQTRIRAHTECKQGQKILLVGQKLSEVARSSIKHRGGKRKIRQLFSGITHTF